MRASSAKEPMPEPADNQSGAVGKRKRTPRTEGQQTKPKPECEPIVVDGVVPVKVVQSWAQKVSKDIMACQVLQGSAKDPHALCNTC